jgi:mercuric ion binding protein
MRLFLGMVATSLLGLSSVAGVAHAETKVNIKGVHLCCGACEKGVVAALKGLDGVSQVCDRKNQTVTLTAADDPAAQKALDALAAAGYHGDIESSTLSIKKETNVPAGKVKSLSLTNLHNCCGSCGKAIKGAVKTVAGVSGDTVKSKQADFEVTGDFDAADVVKALNDAGFHVQVKP